MKKRVIQIVLFILLLVLVLSSQKLWYRFFAASGQYDARYNAEREKRGILPLQEDWITNDKVRDTKAWFPQAKDTSTDVFRGMKLVVVENGKIKVEEDDILKRREGGNDGLQIFSFYDESNTKVYVYNDYTGTIRDTISPWQADSLLRDWKFK
ncbi:hypothetical protein [Chitinophaga sancti]|uniref:Uncharacterized protein n=1 Tax=Chitinophaga sancti TaxID=1004 RepID=A0A1K1SLN3_9BACT|nr:hypothetical protein [Chitinophaga sancti]WQD65435.1 hypothetical protein U0033_13625 [Chitinophaga sancti]WQG88942.1 hypothetical protein SR876_28845 [Chitinophaga sancti]SFW85007.1 hypothetical protein SAMN05661012_05654 [Chitinophaga sancti]